MRPYKTDGGPEREFLGMEFSVARWHVARGGTQLERPPQVEVMRQLVLIAPQYQGAHALPGQQSEQSTLEKMPGFSKIGGTASSLRALFQQMPQAMVHFSGHGIMRQSNGAPEFAIELEDGELDLMSWRGFATASKNNHPFFFFNACEVGESKKVANFVEGWAPAVLNAGASGYIGALWPVNDRVAAEFAARFYSIFEQQQAQQGAVRVADVLAQTRRELYRETGNPTALAYVLYGDTNLRFVAK
jgi:CHAT domain-containing protein